MKILVASCDKNTDIFDAFHQCMEKYWKRHPKVIYATENVRNPYYKTISYDIPLEYWTVRMRKTIEDIDDDVILLMIDDCFIRNKVDKKRIALVEKWLLENDNIACFNFEKSWDANDEMSIYEGFKKRKPGSLYEVNLLCGMWRKDALLKVLDRYCNPWEVEINQISCGYDYYINNEDYIIDWGYTTWHPAGLFKGQWCHEIVPFFEKEGIIVDYEKRGFVTDYNRTIL